MSRLILIYLVFANFCFIILKRKPRTERGYLEVFMSSRTAIRDDLVLPKGTLIHVKSIPFTLIADIVVSGTQANLEATKKDYSVISGSGVSKKFDASTLKTIHEKMDETKEVEFSIRCNKCQFLDLIALVNQYGKNKGYSNLEIIEQNLILK